MSFSSLSVRALPMRHCWILMPPKKGSSCPNRGKFCQWTLRWEHTICIYLYCAFVKNKDLKGGYPKALGFWKMPCSPLCIAGHWPFPNPFALLSVKDADPQCTDAIVPTKKGDLHRKNNYALKNFISKRNVSRDYSCHIHMIKEILVIRKSRPEGLKSCAKDPPTRNGRRFLVMLKSSNQLQRSQQDFVSRS